ncbi:MAG: rhodanese-like domain-containing protein [Bacteroidales bacterium]
MKTLKNLLIIIVPLTVILILVIYKALDKDSFKLDAEEVIKQSINQEHVLSIAEFKEKLAQNNAVVIIDLRKKEDFDKDHIKNAKNIPLENLQQKKSLDFLLNEQNEKILYSETVANSAKAWALFTRLGIEKLYILDVPGELIGNELLNKDTSIEKSEVLKYKFQPDTLSKPE